MKIVKEIVAFVQTEYDKNCQSFVGKSPSGIAKERKISLCMTVLLYLYGNRPEKKTIVVYFSE